MRSLVEAKPGIDFRAVLSNRPEAAGLAWAREQGLQAEAVDHKRHPDRERFEQAMAEAVDRHAPDYIFLAGFMRIFTPTFLARYPRRVVNIHPSLLPAFPGLRTHRQALAAGVKVHGCSVHVVTPELDAGPIIGQAAVPVMADDTEDSLAARVLRAEHRLYPQVARWLAEDRVRFSDAGVVRIERSGVEGDCLVAPRDPA
jgi:phosphoribosylglycinamide formyltransferase-1